MTGKWKSEDRGQGTEADVDGSCCSAATWESQRGQKRRGGRTMILLKIAVQKVRRHILAKHRNIVVLSGFFLLSWFLFFLFVTLDVFLFLIHSLLHYADINIGGSFCRYNLDGSSR